MITFSTRKLCAALLVSSLWIGTTSCGSTPAENNGPVVTGESWIDNPGDIKDVLTATGAAKILGNPSAARTRAEADGRAKIAASAKALIQSLVSNWAKETGDMLDERTISSYLNDEVLIRQITDAELIGARPVKYATRDGVQYVLIMVDDPEKWTKQVGKSMKDRAIKDETLFKTEVMKRDFEDKLDKLINRDADNAKDAKAKFQQAYVK